MNALDEARKWIGYMEHQSPFLLGIYTANVGKGGCSIFAEEIYFRSKQKMQGVPWCATFLHYVINRPDLLGAPHPGTRVLQRRMKHKGFWRDRTYVPCPGDIIFLSNEGNGRVNHCGIVEKVTGDTVISIDGNTVDPSGYFNPEQGGTVAERERDMNDAKIVGYGAIGQYLMEKQNEGGIGE